MAAGMLGDLFSPKYKDLAAEERENEQRLQFQAQDPFRAMAHAAYTGGDMAGKGLGRAVAAATGRDPRTPGERNVQAVESAKQQVAALGFDSEDPKSMDQFYKQVIQILQKQGLAAEAMSVAKEWHAQKTADARNDIALKRETRQEERDRRAHELGILRIASATEIAAARNATAKEIADAKLDAKKLETGPFKSVDYGDHVDIINRFGEVVSSKPKAMSPKDGAKADDKKKDAEQAYGEYLAGLQRQYNAAVKLHNHPGVEGITGRFGRWVGEEKDAPMLGTAASMLSSDAAGAALALYKQVTGGTFLAGLAKLKAASKTGATGLGAVSEREGDKVQSDAAALDRLQQAPAFRSQLATYIREMEGFADRLAAAAQADKIAPKALAKQPLTVPTKGRQKPAAPAAPAAAPSAPTGDRVRVRHPNGTEGDIPRAQLEAAKAQGYTEIQ